MNIHIKLVKKWLADNDSVTQKELKNNAADAANNAAAYDNDAADAAYAGYAGYAYAAADVVDAAYAYADNATAYAAYAADAAAHAAAHADADAAAYWVKRYEELKEKK